jgi:hypothetical protein
MRNARSLSVAAAARELKMHRASVHRYLLRWPEIRNARGKVVMARLIEQIEQAKRDEPRGRKLAMQPRRVATDNLPAVARGLRRSLREYNAWRKELGSGWRNWRREDFLEVAECFAEQAAFFVELERWAKTAPLKPAPTPPA